MQDVLKWRLGGRGGQDLSAGSTHRSSPLNWENALSVVTIWNPERKAKIKKISSKPPEGEQNGCRQRLGWHLSRHRRFPLDVA